MPYFKEVSFAEPQTAEEMENARRQELAKQLQAQSQAPLQGQNVPGGWYVPPSPVQGLAKLAQGYLGGKMGRETQEAQAKILSERQGRQSADLSLLAKALQGRQAEPAGVPEDAAGNTTQTPAMPSQTPAQSLGQAIPMMSPQIQQAAIPMLLEQQKMQQQQPFTLSPGATRYDAQGRPMASAPVTPKQPEPFTLAPGATRYDAQGRPIAQSSQQQAPQVAIDMKGETEYAKKVSGLAGERDIGQHDAAMAATENIIKINQQLDLMKNSQAITGLGSEIFKNVERTRALFLQDKAAGKRVSDTELLDAMLGQDVFPMIKQLGIGARGLDTPAERDFLRNVMTGTTPLNRNTLIRLAEIRRDISERSIKRWNERIGSGELDRYFKATGMPRQKIDIPKAKRAPGSVPQGIDPAVWGVMTPEQKALWNE